MNPATIDELITQSSVNLWTVLGEAAGVVALILSAINFFHYYKSRRVNYCVKLVDYNLGYIKEIEKQKLRVTFEIVNNSQLSVTITDLRLLAGGNTYPESKLPFVVYHYIHRINDREYPQFFYNDHLPLKLEALGSLQCHLVFLLPPYALKNSETHLNFQICTNRNTELEFSLSAGERICHRRRALKVKTYNS